MNDYLQVNFDTGKYPIISWWRTYFLSSNIVSVISELVFFQLMFVVQSRLISSANYFLNYCNMKSNRSIILSMVKYAHALSLSWLAEAYHSWKNTVLTSIYSGLLNSDSNVENPAPDRCYTCLRNNLGAYGFLHCHTIIHCFF